MPSQAWLDAANKTDRRPVLLMSVESVTALKKNVTTQADWEASKAKSNTLETSYSIGDVSLRVLYLHSTTEYSHYFAPEWNGGPRGWIYHPFQGLYMRSLMVGAFWWAAYGDALEFFIRIVDSESTVLYTSPAFVVQGVPYPGDPLFRYGPAEGYKMDIPPIYADQENPIRIELVASEANPDIINYSGGGSLGSGRNLADFYYPSGTLRTRTVDLGLVPTQPAVFGADDTVRVGCTLTYSARGSNDDSTWVDLGAVVDGGTLAPYRYYDFQASFVSDGTATPVLHGITVSGGDSQFKYFSTHEDTPVQGARPYLLPSLGSLRGKLALMKLGSTGEVSPKLFYLQETMEMIRDGYLKNKAVSIKMGFDNGMSESDYEPLFTGVWYDYSLDLRRSEVSVKMRSVLSRFQKVQLPRELGVNERRSEVTCPPVEWINEPIMTVMLEIIDLMGIPDRYIDRDGFTALATGARSGGTWAVSRRIDKDNKEDALKLLEELSVLSGVFLLQSPDGRLIPSLYDPDAPIVAEIDEDLAKNISTVEGGQSELFTRQQICYTLRRVGDLEQGVNRFDWAADKDYSRNDSVTVLGVTWYCLLSHRSATENAPGTGAKFRAYWATDWQSSHAYLAGEVVIGGGPLYTCSLNHTSAASTEPGKGVDWRTRWTVQPARDGSSPKDFYNAYVLINASAELNWGLNLLPEDPDFQNNPGYQKTWLDKWNAHPLALQALAERMDLWFANPTVTLKAVDLPPRFFAGDQGEEILGAMVGVSGLVLPTEGGDWDVPCDKKKFWVMNKILNPEKCSVTLELLEVRT